MADGLRVDRDRQASSVRRNQFILHVYRLAGEYGLSDGEVLAEFAHEVSVLAAKMHLPENGPEPS